MSSPTLLRARLFPFLCVGVLLLWSGCIGFPQPNPGNDAGPITDTGPTPTDKGPQDTNPTPDKEPTGCQQDPTLGQPCTAGIGACQTQGVLICKGTQVLCDATPNPNASTTEQCDGIDNDCNGTVDDGLTTGQPCQVPGAQGPCAKGTNECVGGKLLCKPSTQPTTETCNGQDDDCDGKTDEELTRTCQSPCGQGKELCNNGTFGPCDAPTPTQETCNGKDDDCNGKIDDGLMPPPCDNQKGACAGSVKRCEGGQWVACTEADFQKNNGAASLTPETDCDGMDNDCNGKTDEGCTKCNAGETKPCYSGPSGTAGQGSCKAGVQTCQSDRSWGACVGEVQPKQESCDNIDSDCDGQVDEGLTKACKSPCGPGVSTCSQGTYGACKGPAPQAETCNGKDDDCNGQIDDNLTPPLCRKQVGVCKGAVQQCVPSQGGWKLCGTADYVKNNPAVELAGETKCDGLDNDCDGKTDEGCPTCTSSEVYCNNKCANLQTDDNNCGTCGTKCAAGATCKSGVCKQTVTATGSCYNVLCGGACTDIQTDAKHCGACGNACAAGQWCCGGKCVAPNTDDNCGKCGNKCLSIHSCQQGTCKIRPDACPSGYGFCDGACLKNCTPTQCAQGLCPTNKGDRTGCAGDTYKCPGSSVCVNLNSKLNCGGCDRVCAKGSSCLKFGNTGACSTDGGIGGKCDGVYYTANSTSLYCASCYTTCPPHLSCMFTGAAAECVGSSFDYVSCNGTYLYRFGEDPNNCGNCNNKCATGQYCGSGACFPGPPPSGYPWKECSQKGTWTDTRKDALNCGNCGNICANDKYCTNGKCHECRQLNMVRCNGVCVFEDNQNCGTCGNACAIGKTCNQGKCI